MAEQCISKRCKELEELVKMKNQEINELKSKNMPTHACYECKQSYVQEQLDVMMILKSMLKPINVDNPLAREVTQLQEQVMKQVVDVDLLKHKILRSSTFNKELITKYILELENLRNNMPNLIQKTNKLKLTAMELKDGIGQLCTNHLQDCDKILLDLKLQDKKQLDSLITHI